ncbi:hypothetical protein [Hymenobacter siberiensis]|uniref:hypothetical protein n=1 Tax=Hymenobacter siberiensis TaxID=2848396 RepID=UPI001C1E5E70|nr:hypothetical protein [Hymenobacter siberiensis]
MKKLILVLMFLLFNNVCFSQDADYLGFVRPDTGYNDFHDTNFNNYWGKKEGTITNQILNMMRKNCLDCREPVKKRTEL